MNITSKQYQAILNRLTKLENKLLTINTAEPSLHPLNPYPSPSISRAEAQDIIQKIEMGDKLQAIKSFRHLFSCGLMEAKNMVDAIEMKVR